MKQFKALLIKEWHTHKSVFLIPSLVLGAFFLLLILVSLFARIRYGAPQINLEAMDGLSTILVLRNLHYVVSVVLGGFAVIASVQLTDHLLNQDYVKKCEILHHSQPVSLAKMLWAKFVFSVPLMMVQFAVLAVISSLILSAVAAFMGYKSWGFGLAAVLSPFWLIFIAMMTISSLIWLFSCAFRKQAMMKSFVTLAVIELLRLWLMNLWGAVNIFSPLNYYMSSLTLPFSLFSLEGAQASLVLQSAVSAENLIRLGVSILMYIGGYFFYRRRELF